jgi:hypothetical protein
MNKQEQEHHFEMMGKKMKEILLSKGDDYANTDRLSNFKLSGAICGLTPELGCLHLIAVKVSRLGVLLQPTSGEPKNESVQDSIIDLANYSVLLSMIVREQQQLRAKESGISLPQKDKGTAK